MGDVKTPSTVSTKVRRLVFALVGVLVVGAVATSLLRDAHLDRAEQAFLADVSTRFPSAEIAADTLACHESLTAGMFKDETVRCRVAATHRGRPGRFLAFMPPDFEWVDAAFHAD